MNGKTCDGYLECMKCDHGSVCGLTGTTICAHDGSCETTKCDRCGGSGTEFCWLCDEPAVELRDNHEDFPTCQDCLDDPDPILMAACLLPLSSDSYSSP